MLASASYYTELNLFGLADIHASDDCVGDCVHGTCVDGFNSFTCDCHYEYTGTLCDTREFSDNFDRPQYKQYSNVNFLKSSSKCTHDKETHSTFFTATF